MRAGASVGKARSLMDDLGKTMASAGPSIAVQLVGLDVTPQVGGWVAQDSSPSTCRSSRKANAM